MASLRMLKLEIVGCALLLAAALALYFSAPDSPWGERGRAEGDETGKDPELAATAERERVEPRLPAPEKPRPPRLEVNGRLIVIDATGTERNDRSGEVFLKLEFDADPAEVHRVEVKNGAFSASAYLGAWVTCETATIDGEYATVDLPRTRLNPGEELVLRARVRSRPRIIVLDEANRTPVASVTLWTAHGPGWLFPPSLDDLSVIGAPGPSPREIASDLPPLSLWIDAAGFAYERINAVPSRGTTTTVLVTAPATLRIQLVGAPPPDGLVIALKREDHDGPELQRIEVAGNPTFVLERLRPQRLAIEAFVPSELPKLRASAIADLLGNAVTDRALDLAP